LNTTGISKIGGLIDVAIEFDIIQKSGSFYKYKGKVIGQGKEAVRIYLLDNPKTAQAIETEIWKIIKKEK